MHLTGTRAVVTCSSPWAWEKKERSDYITSSAVHPVATPTVSLDRALQSTVSGSGAAPRYVGVFPAHPVGLIARDPHIGHYEEGAWLLRWRNHAAILMHAFFKLHLRFNKGIAKLMTAFGDIGMLCTPRVLGNLVIYHSSLCPVLRVVIENRCILGSLIKGFFKFSY